MRIDVHVFGKHLFSVQTADADLDLEREVIHAHQRIDGCFTSLKEHTSEIKCVDERITSLESVVSVVEARLSKVVSKLGWENKVETNAPVLGPPYIGIR